MSKKISAGIWLIAAAMVTAGCRPHPSWREKTLFAFDTVCDIKLYATAGQFRSAERAIDSIFRGVEESFSPEAEDLSSPRVLELYRIARQTFEDSGGAFDITVKPLSRLWGFGHNSSYVPTPAQVEDALRLVGMEKIMEKNGRLVLPPGAGLDWGGIAKGWAVDAAAEALRDLGLAAGFINAGGNLYCWGKNPEAGPWKVGVKHPRREGLLGVLSLSDCGAATSGDYQRYFESGGVRYHHIFDPKTGYPARGKQSVTIIGPRAVICDALSTAIFVSASAEDILGKYPDYGAIIVDDQGRVTLLGKRFQYEPGQ